MRAVVYCATNDLNDHQYVGVTICGMKGRRVDHHSAARNGGHLPFHKALRKYGTENFTWSVLGEYETEAEGLAAEIRFIAEMKPRYNILKGGKGTGGLSHSAETKAKIGAASKGHVTSTETKAKMAAQALGRVPGPEAREKIGAAHRGKRLSDIAKERISNSLKGHEVTPETRAKISRAQKGRKATPESIARLSATHRGKKQSPETVEKRAIKLRGRIFSDEHRAKIAAGRTGKKHTTEARARMSAARMGKPRLDLRGKKRSPEQCAVLRRIALGRTKEWAEHGTLGSKATARRVICLDDGVTYESASAAARNWGLSKSAVIQTCHGDRRYRTVGGKRFQYETPTADELAAYSVRDLARRREKLSAAAVGEIRLLFVSHSDREIAKRFGVSHAAIYDIRRGVTWKEIIDAVTA